MRLITGVLVLAAIGCAGARADIAPEQAVLSAERDIARAQVENDVGAADRLLAPTYAFTLPNGVVVQKSEFLDNMRAWWRPLAVEDTAQAVTVFGDAAVVRGEARYRWAGKSGAEEEARERYTDVYVRDGGSWRRAASHSSCLAGRCT